MTSDNQLEIENSLLSFLMFPITKGIPKLIHFGIGKIFSKYDELAAEIDKEYDETFNKKATESSNKSL